MKALVYTGVEELIYRDEKDPVEKEKALRALLIASIVGGGLATLFFSMSLHTKISPKGIFFTYSPFKKEKLYKWEDLTALSLGKHKPIKAASLLFPPKNNLKQTVYIVWGKTNVLLRFKNGETMLIGTQKPAEMAAFLKRLKQKVEAGADYVVTQMFFDNKKYFDFVEACREFGINVPIIPGLKPIKTLNHITFLPKFFHIDYPEELSNELLKCKTNAEVEKVGIEWGIEQSKKLMQKEVPCIHYYTMSNSDSVKAIARKIF